jgi:plasmid stabilization system protein ParE
LAKDIDKKLKQLSKYPETGRPSLSDPEIRFVKIGKNTELYYMFDGTIIQLLDFFDTRQDPTKRPF